MLDQSAGQHYIKAFADRQQIVQVTVGDLDLRVRPETS